MGSIERVKKGFANSGKPLSSRDRIGLFRLYLIYETITGVSEASGYSEATVAKYKRLDNWDEQLSEHRAMVQRGSSEQIAKEKIIERDELRAKVSLLIRNIFSRLLEDESIGLADIPTKQLLKDLPPLVKLYLETEPQVPVGEGLEGVSMTTLMLVLREITGAIGEDGDAGKMLEGLKRLDLTQTIERAEGLPGGSPFLLENKD